jgi:thiamine biosynthesis lipoprotein
LTSPAAAFAAIQSLSGLNRTGGRPVKVSSTLFSALELAVRAAVMTDGLVDPTVGRSLRLAGYDMSIERLRLRPDGVLLPTFEPAGRFREIALNRQRRTVRIPDAVEMDLGASAKAFTADVIAAAAAGAIRGGAPVSIGGDIAVAGRPPEEGWPVLVAEEHTASLETTGQVVASWDGGLASSGTRVRRWASSVGELHHIIHPRVTGSPPIQRIAPGQGLAREVPASLRRASTRW